MTTFKKATKITLYSILAFGTLFTALLAKSFWGGSNPNLHQFEEKTKNVLLKPVSSAFLISSVRADLPCCYSCACCCSGTGAAS